MNQVKQYSFSAAAATADYIYKLLAPHCERINIAGSIRRMKPTVKDIEIVCIPKREEITKPDGLFESVEIVVDRNFTEALLTITDKVIRGNVEGRMMKILTTSKKCPGIELDLFMPHPDDYFRQYAIRTGSGDYSHKILATAWGKKGWCGVPGAGLRLITQCESKTDGSGKTIWSLKKDIPESEIQRPPVWHSELEFFRWLQIPFIDPEFREVIN